MNTGVLVVDSPDRCRGCRLGKCNHRNFLKGRGCAPKLSPPKWHIGNVFPAVGNIRHITILPALLDFAKHFGPHLRVRKLWCSKGKFEIWLNVLSNKGPEMWRSRGDPYVLCAFCMAATISLKARLSAAWKEIPCVKNHLKWRRKYQTPMPVACLAIAMFATSADVQSWACFQAPSCPRSSSWPHFLLQGFKELAAAPSSKSCTHFRCIQGGLRTYIDRPGYISRNQPTSHIQWIKAPRRKTCTFP